MIPGVLKTLLATKVFPSSSILATFAIIHVHIAQDETTSIATMEQPSKSDLIRRIVPRRFPLCLGLQGRGNPARGGAAAIKRTLYTSNSLTLPRSLSAWPTILPVLVDGNEGGFEGQKTRGSRRRVTKGWGGRGISVCRPSSTSLGLGLLRNCVKLTGVRAKPFVWKQQRERQTRRRRTID